MGADADERGGVQDEEQRRGLGEFAAVGVDGERRQRDAAGAHQGGEGGEGGGGARHAGLRVGGSARFRGPPSRDLSMLRSRPARRFTGARTLG